MSLSVIIFIIVMKAVLFINILCGWIVIGFEQMIGAFIAIRFKWIVLISLFILNIFIIIDYYY